MVRSGRPESSSGIAVIATLSSSSLNRSPAAARTNAIRSAGGSSSPLAAVPAREPEDVGVAGGHRQQAVAVAAISILTSATCSAR